LHQIIYRIPKVFLGLYPWTFVGWGLGHQIPVPDWGSENVATLQTMVQFEKKGQGKRKVLRVCDTNGLQCFDAVGWPAGRASGL